VEMWSGLKEWYSLSRLERRPLGGSVVILMPRWKMDMRKGERDCWTAKNGSLDEGSPCLGLSSLGRAAVGHQVVVGQEDPVTEWESILDFSDHWSLALPQGHSNYPVLHSDLIG